MAQPFDTRIPRKLDRTITFTGASGAGAIGTVAVASVSPTGGAVWLLQVGIVVQTTLVGTSATLILGTVGNTNAIMTTTTATTLTAGKLWMGGAAIVGCSYGQTNANLILVLPLIITIATANVTAGALQFSFYWLPCGGNGQLT